MNMLSTTSNQVLDAVLSLQLTVAWAGEGAHPRVRGVQRQEQY